MMVNLMPLLTDFLLNMEEVANFAGTIKFTNVV